MAPNSATCWPDWMGPASRSWKSPNGFRQEAGRRRRAARPGTARRRSARRSTIPVRMYLREMGTVPLLTARRRNGNRAAHRARPEHGAEIAVARAAGDPGNHLDLGEEMAARHHLGARRGADRRPACSPTNWWRRSGEEFVRSAEEIARHYQQDHAVPAEAAGHSARHEAQTVPPAACGRLARAHGAGFAPDARRSVFRAR